MSHQGECSDDEKDDVVDDAVDDDGFFVPHGYLSEGEGCEDEDEDISPERLKGKTLFIIFIIMFSCRYAKLNSPCSFF